MRSPDDLLDAGAWGLEGRGEAVELITTHCSWVFRLRERVFKVKRPVDLGFLDFTTLAARQAACEAEVALNTRLAPGVYLGVVPIVLGADGKHRRGGVGTPVDWAVEMVRLDDAQQADALLGRGALGPEEISRLAERLAAFHAEARSDAHTASFGLPRAVAVNVEENFRQAAPFIERFISRREAELIQSFQRSVLDQRAPLFEARAAGGRVRDGHGDLRLEHVYFRPGGELSILDCIEFNERFRYADVASDVAFLAMDLAIHGRADLAELLFARYARAANDYDLYPLADFYESYRAFVRGKVSGMLAADEAAPAQARAEAWARARRYFLLALAEARLPLWPPRVVAFGGLIATGKSTVADALAVSLFVPVVDADRTRKSLLGVEPLRSVQGPDPWQGAYGAEMTARTYRELLRRAGVVLDSGRAVVLDASFRSAAWRAEARALARARGVPFTFVECRAPEALCRERLRARKDQATVSDAREDLYDSFARKYEPVQELAAEEHLVLDTSQPLEECVAALRRALGAG